MGAWHARFARMCGGRVCGVVDRSLAAAERLAAKFKHAHSGTDLREFLSRMNPAIVHVCTPVETHPAIAKAALDAGAHVIVEKPLAIDAKASEDLIRSAQSSGLLLIPVHQFLFQDGFREACRSIPRLGRILHVDSVICSAGGEHGTRDLDEIVAEILPHPLSLIERLAPGAIRADFAVLRPGCGEWRIYWEANGVSFSILISMHARPTEASMRIAGEKGSIEVDFFHGFSTIDCAPATRGSKIARPFRRSAAQLAIGTKNLGKRAARGEIAYPGLRTLISEFYDAVRGKTPPPISAEETVAVASACDRIVIWSRA